MSQCKKFAPNIFHKTKCSNCFRQKEEHSAEALECNRASRSIARSGYLFVAPDWDFSVPLNRTKRWQRRWFVLYDDGELNYSVDEHPDTVPQGSVDMSKVLEVTGAEQVTGHAHSLALTGPDRVTFIKATSREDARWWAELLAVFPRRHKRNATFPGGRASPSLPQLGRSASPQPPRLRHLSCTGPSPRTNFTTPPLKEERESPGKEEGVSATATTPTSRPGWVPEPTRTLPIESAIRTDYIVTSGSPPTRDKLRCDDKARARRDWRNERLRDIATALTDRSPESSLALPAEGLLHLKKGWLWLKDPCGEWLRRWVVLCGPALSIYRDQDEQCNPEVTVELSTVTGYSEIPTESKYGFQIQWSGPTLALSAVTAGIRSNWLQALKKAAPNTAPSSESPPAPATPRSVLLSSDEEYRTASEGGRRGSEDWGELPPSPPLARTPLARVKERARARPKLPRCQSRQSTLDSVSTDELDTGNRDVVDGVDRKNTINRQKAEIDDLQKQLSKAVSEVHNLEEQINKLKKHQSESLIREQNTKEMLRASEQTELDLNEKNLQLEVKYLREQKIFQRRLAEAEETLRNTEEKCNALSRELQSKQLAIFSLQEELSRANERNAKEESDSRSYKTRSRIDSLTDLTNVDLDVDLENLTQNELIEHCLDLRSRFEKAVLEIRTVKRELRESFSKYDSLELKNFGLQHGLEMAKKATQAENALMVARIDHLTAKLAAAEKQLRSKSRQETKDKRRSLSLKGRESFSINKEVEDKVTELEAKILSIERSRPKRRYRRERSSERSSPIDDRSLRRLRRKSLDSATASESMRLLMRLSSLDSKVTNVMASNESLSTASITDLPAEISSDCALSSAREKLTDCLNQVTLLRSNRSKRSSSPSSDRLSLLEHSLNEICDILSRHVCGVSGPEAEVINTSANTVVKQLQSLLLEKLARVAEKRKTLRESNKLDTRASLELIAEKIAYENILIARIQEALEAPATSEPICERLANKETKETIFLLQSLQAKLAGVAQKQPPVCKTSAEYLSKVLAKCLTNAANEIETTNASPKRQKLLPSIDALLEQQRRINALYNSYKTTKLPQLADALAVETLSLASDRTCRLKDETVDVFSRTAHETVNRELMESEINHVMLRAAQIYESNLSDDNVYFFSFFASERAALELWSDSVENHLYAEINKNIQDITEQYQNSINRLPRQARRRRVESERACRSAGKLLSEFADVVAHKALIDARIGVLNGERHLAVDCGPLRIEKSLEIERCRDYLEDDASLVQINQSLEAEFKCMVDRYSSECLFMLERPELERVLEGFSRLCVEVYELRKCVDLCRKGGEEDVVVFGWEDVCQKCFLIAEQLEEVRKVFTARVQMSSKKSDSEDDRRPVYLGTEYLNQVENLRAAYRQALAACEDRHKQADIEQLQVLCERVLVAIEHWHRRTLHDLREAHGKELHVLRQDKEQALAEETQATLAALDAMRKAHEAEVQREVARFKQDFARQQRDEIMDLSERLSVKCLEAAALEEQLSSATRQLAHAQQHILQLERNPQLSTVQN